MTQNSGNQRVTNAILGGKLDGIAKDVKEIKGDMKLNTEARITHTERWKAHDKEHASLNTKKWADNRRHSQVIRMRRIETRECAGRGWPDRGGGLRR
jgi:hypothetical protein